MSTIKEIAEYSKTVNQKYLCISDHGSLGAVPNQIKYAEKHNLKPIFAIELYCNPLQPELKEGEESGYFYKLLDDDSRKIFRKSYHLLAIAYSDKGYENLVKLSSLAWTKGLYYKPRVNHEQLLKYKEGIIFTSCCYNSEIGQAFDQGGDEAGFQMVEKYLKMFGSNFYLEIMLLDFKKQKPYDIFILKAHQKYGIPVILTNDSHYTLPEDSKYQRLMLMIQTKKTLEEVNKKSEEQDSDLFELQDTNLWMKSEEELNDKWLKDYSDVIEYDIFKQSKLNTVEICKRACNVKLDRSSKLPDLPDANRKLMEAIMIGFKYRCLPYTKEYLNRLKEEYELICDKEFASYFLIQKMMTDEARRISPILLGWGTGHEALGPGRGCLSGDSKIITDNGKSIPISEIKSGQKVYTIDGTLQKVINKFEYDCNEDLLRIKTYYGDCNGISLTSDHKVYAEKAQCISKENWATSTKNSRKKHKDPTGNCEWIPASSLSVGDWLFFPKIYFYQHNISIDEIDLSKYSTDENHSYDNEYVYQDWMNPLTKMIRKRKKCIRKIKIDLDFFRFLGLFAGDGWIRSDQSKRVGIAFHRDDSDGVKFMVDWAEKYELEYFLAYHKTKKLIQFSINNYYIFSLIKDLFPQYEYTSQSKHVPEMVFHQSTDKILAFLQGMYWSDGCSKGSKLVYSTSSCVLAEQIRFLSWKCMIPASMQSYHRCDKRNGKFNDGFVLNLPRVKSICDIDYNKSYNFKIIDDGILIKVRSITKEKSDGKVYDLQVENNHNYLTSSFLVHNSAVGSLICYCLGITDVDPVKHDLLFSRFLSPARGGKSMKLYFTIDPIKNEEEANKKEIKILETDECPFEPN